MLLSILNIELGLVYELIEGLLILADKLWAVSCQLRQEGCGAASDSLGLVLGIVQNPVKYLDVEVHDLLTRRSINGTVESN